jgi:hypothetical protein
MPGRLAASTGTPTVTIAAYSEPPGAGLRSVRLTLWLAPATRGKVGRLTVISEPRSRLRSGLTSPLAVAIQGRGVIVMFWVVVVVLATTIEPISPDAGGLSGSTLAGTTDSPPPPSRLGDRRAQQQRERDQRQPGNRVCRRRGIGC